jgi:energy-coupling factor transport system permease protein
MLVLLAQRCQPIWLLALALLCSAAALRWDASQFISLLRRTRWVAFSLLLIYAWATPGRAVLGGMGVLSPTWEGLLDGAMQLARLLCALAGLAVLLSSLTRGQLVGGLYTLTAPLRLLGLSRERFAVRLALTLEYAEAAMHGTPKDWRATIGGAMDAGASGVTSIELHHQRYAVLDGVLLLAGMLILAGVWR